MLELKQELNAFGKYVVKQSRRRLTQGKTVTSDTKKLYKSIGFENKVSKNSFQFSFMMEEYGKFQDRGVKGKGGSKADGTRWKVKKTFGTPYRYKSKKPPVSAFNGWAVRKGIAPRNKKGQFVSRKSLLFAISNSVYHRGIATSLFFTKPFEDSFKRLPDELIEKYALDVEKFLNTTTKNGFN